MLNFAARKADQIVTVSNYSKAQIVEALGIPASKITVIHCGVGAEFHPEYNKEECRSVVSRLGISRPYLLYVGNLKPHKNVSTLLQAVAQLHQRKKLSHELVIVGDDARWKRAIVDECLRLGIATKLYLSRMFPRHYCQRFTRRQIYWSCRRMRKDLVSPLLRPWLAGLPWCARKLRAFPRWREMRQFILTPTTRAIWLGQSSGSCIPGIFASR